MGLSGSVVRTLQSARAPSTRAAYSYRWELFVSWCKANQFDALSCSAPEVLRYLQELLESGKSCSTLRGVVAAIKASRVGEAKLTAQDASLIAQFLKGAQRLVPRSRPTIPTWDLSRVLSAVGKEPFEPLETVSLQWLSLKLAFLLAITSAKRVGELQALSVQESCCRFLPEDGGVILRPNPAFLPKVLTDFHLNQSVELRALRPSEGADGLQWSALCPVRALKIYIQRTAAFRTTDQLFVCFQPQRRGKPVSKAGLSHWVVDAIHRAYSETGEPVPEGVKAHSTRGVSTSWALWRGAALSEVCAAATWATPNTFTRFYSLNVAASTSFGERVLGARST